MTLSWTLKFFFVYQRREFLKFQNIYPYTQCQGYTVLLIDMVKCKDDCYILTSWVKQT